MGHLRDETHGDHPATPRITWEGGVHRTRTALATPRSVKALIGPAPRVIADDVWAKLLWAGLHLEPADLATARGGYCYPIELVRALAVTWLFSGLRADEIARLRTGCVRWHASSDASEEPVCLLDIPSHKTGAPFTKPVDPLVGHAIETWEAVRPVQPLRLDPRTGERVAAAVLPPRPGASRGNTSTTR